MKILAHWDTKMKMQRWQILLIPFVIAAGFILYSIVHYGVNTPLWDDWDSVPLFQKADNHTLGFSDLWAQRNEHRILFPNIVFLISAYATHWNIKFELLISFVFSVITALMLYLFVLSKIKQRSIALLASILIAAWFYSPIQYENWLSGVQIIWFMSVAAMAVSLYFLDRFGSAKHINRRLIFGAALVSAVIASYSMGDGLLLWPIGLGILVAYRETKQSISVWIAAALGTISIYYYHYKTPANSSPPTLFLHQRLEFIRYVFSYLGSAITSYPPGAEGIGVKLTFVLLALLYMVWMKRNQIEKFVPWLSLIGVALLSAVITAIARLNLGIAQSTTSRYAVFSLLYVIGLTGLACAVLDSCTVKRNTIAILIISGVTAPLLIASYAYGTGDLQRQSAFMEDVKYCTREANPDRACLLLTAPYPNRNTILTGAQLKYIKTKHWAGY
jgi:hypothetical protein